ncbi:YraN family protein [Corallococcus sp. H22C18031201]|uniref:YraN family protein n=1 Tax=Citreicoccus inhibens TaxID=2849499 RepID=UPI000E709697|nr:YraN family protein [Citreicoccus inhibens]MBU8897081.1 YraN family protein [Citreicoccus inhibens]RJS19702.1 YraN family protein [Corallococcus sp. H22C18031201]
MGRAAAPGDRRGWGNTAEDSAVRFLEARGWRVRARNWTCRYGELDVVAERDEFVCFVEVRMRSSTVCGEPVDTVSFAKQRRVVKAAMHYLFQYDVRERMVRFDVISVVGRGAHATVEHIPGAFDAGM